MSENHGLFELGAKAVLISGQHILATKTSSDNIGLPYLTGPADFRDNLPAPSKYARDGQRCEPNDTLVVVKGSGAGAAFLSNGNYIISRQLMALRATECDAKYLYQVIGRLRAYFEGNARGAIPGISREQILLTVAYFPPLPEQRRIATILDEWDKAIATVEKLVQSQQRRKRGLIKSVFFGDANWFDASISELADVVGGGTPSTDKRAYWDGDIPWCTPTDITGLDTRYIEATERTISETGLAASNASLLPVGSIILCSRASVGECAINLVPMATNQGFQSLVPKDQNDRYFLYYLVQAYKPELIRLSAGSTFMEFPKSALRTMNIRIPEAEKRQEVGLLFNDVDDELDQTVALLKRLRLQKRGLMQKLLNGDWPVPASIDRLLPGGRDIDEAVGAEVQRAEATG